MKKLFTLAAALTLALSLTACGSTSDAPSGTDTAADSIADSTELLTTVWDALDDDVKFPAVGGDYDNPVDAAPGAVDISNPDNLDSLLAFPADEASQIDGAASLSHMMNANTFTAGAFHVTDAENVTAVADAIHENLVNRRWMCGFPEKLVILTDGEYVVSAFGIEDFVNPFRDTMQTCYSAAAVAYDEPIE